MNNKNSDLKQKKKNIQKKIQFSVWYLVIGLILVTFLNNYNFSRTALKRIPYNQFEQWIASNEVAQVNLFKENIQGTLKDNSPHIEKGEKNFQTVHIEDKDLVNELQKAGVEYSGKIEDTRLKDLFFV